MKEQRDDGRTRVREGFFAGIRLVGVWVPWQGVAVVLVVTALLGGLLVVRLGNRPVEVRQVAAADSSTTTSTSEAVTTTTSTTAPPTIVAPTTAPPPPTTTTIAPGSEEIVIYGGSVTLANGQCGEDQETGDWEYIAHNCRHEMRGELVFRVDARRYPPKAVSRVTIGVELREDTTFCFRIINADTKHPVDGTEKCWVSTAKPPEPYKGHVPHRIDEEYGAFRFPGSGRYTPQVKLSRTSTGGKCFMGTSGGCTSGFNHGKVYTEW